MALQAADENSAAPIVKPFWRVAIKQRKPKTGSGSSEGTRPHRDRSSRSVRRYSRCRVIPMLASKLSRDSFNRPAETGLFSS
jgi:hypothetical protein